MQLNDLDTQRQAEKLRHNLERLLHIPEAWPGLDFLISSLTQRNPFNSTEEIAEWLDAKRSRHLLKVQQIPLGKLRGWRFDPHTSDLSHDTGGFFAIRGLEVRTNSGPVKHWTQPIIDQPQIGLLGILARKISGIIYLLIQAKAEPGNVGGVQLAPTVQATRSNYTLLHGGRKTPFLEYFLNGTAAEILFDQHQSEQGARFYRKRNRNMVVRTCDDEIIEPHPDFRWVTLGQLKRLMRSDDTVNMDTRSVISTISYCPEHQIKCNGTNRDDLMNCLADSPLVETPPGEIQLDMMLSACSQNQSRHSMDELLRIFSREKFQAELETRLIPLREVKDWVVSPQEIRHVRDLFFSVIGVRVAAQGREVEAWDQPIIRQNHAGIIGFLMRRFDGILHFLIQLKLESGNNDLLGIAPTVQCITGSYEVGDLPPFVGEMLKPKHSRIIFDTMQSEEGGRFYQESNRNLLLLADDDSPLELPPRYEWVTLRQLKQLLAFNNFLNVESRSLLAMI
jgi:oxidase EvaA